MLKHHPYLAMKFSWKGCVKMSKVDLNSSHAPALVEIMNSNTEVVEIDMRVNPNIGHKGIEIMTEGLNQNKTLRKLSFADCGIDDIPSKFVGSLLKENDTLQYVWLLDNKHIGDEGAKMIMQAVVDEGGHYGQSGFNNTLCHVYIDSFSVRNTYQEIFRRDL